MNSTDELSYRFPMPVTHYRCEGNKKSPFVQDASAILKQLTTSVVFAGSG